MRTILHIGTPKTGSTSIQLSLSRQREALLDKGVLYPQRAKKEHAHHFLSPLLVPQNALWQATLDHHGHDREGMLRQTEKDWDRIQRSIDAHKPETLVLSSESFFWATSLETAPLWAKLAEMSDDITVVAYLRDPMSFCSALYFENAKRFRYLNKPQPVHYRDQLESYAALPKARLSVRSFDREHLVGHDVVNDFSMTHLNGALEMSEPVESNRSLSPEGAALFQQYKCATNKGTYWRLEQRDYNILARLRRADMALAASSPGGLKPEVKEFVTSSFQDAHWLEQNFGIKFRNQYPENATGWRPWPYDRAGLEDVFDLDTERQSELLASLNKRIPELWHVLNGTPVWRPVRFKYEYFRFRRRLLRRIGLSVRRHL